MIIYVTTQGSKVIREGRHLLVTCGESICHTLFPQKLEQLVLQTDLTDEGIKTSVDPS